MWTEIDNSIYYDFLLISNIQSTLAKPINSGQAKMLDQ